MLKVLKMLKAENAENAENAESAESAESAEKSETREKGAKNFRINVIEKKTNENVSFEYVSSVLLIVVIVKASFRH